MADTVLFEADDALSEVHLAEWSGHPNLVDYWETDGSVTAADTGGTAGQYDEVTIPAFKAWIGYTGADNLTRVKSAKRDTSTTKSLTEGSTNHVYVSIDNDSGANNNVTLTVNTTGSTPSDPFGDGSTAISIKLCTVDASVASGGITEVNRGPAATFAGDPAVELLDGDLRMSEGTAIEDGGGTRRHQFDSSETTIFDPSGNIVFEANDVAAHLRLRTIGSNPFILYDSGGSFPAVNYLTAASAPGTLELTNAKLKHTVTNTSDPRADSTADEWIEVETPNGTRYIQAYA